MTQITGQHQTLDGTELHNTVNDDLPGLMLWSAWAGWWGQSQDVAVQRDRSEGSLGRGLLSPLSSKALCTWGKCSRSDAGTCAPPSPMGLDLLLLTLLPSFLFTTPCSPYVSQDCEWSWWERPPAMLSACAWAVLYK